MSRVVTAAVALCLVLAAAGSAVAEPHRTLLVLEYRAGARGAPGIGDRLAHLLRANAALDVIDAPEARRRVGARLDAEVARCSGDPLCIGTLGEGLNADEVLLVGVSQLGDVVMALQRIDAHKGVAISRLAESLPPETEPTDEDLFNWLKELFPPETFRRWGNIRIVADVDGVAVQMNGELKGKTPIAPVRLRAPGTYKLQLEKRGFVPFQARIDLLPDANVEVRATLVRESGTVVWYKRWYVWAAIGGAVAAATAGVAIYYGTRVDQTPMGFIVTKPK